MHTEKGKGLECLGFGFEGFFHMKYKIKTPSMVCLYDCFTASSKFYQDPLRAHPRPMLVIFRYLHVDAGQVVSYITFLLR